jgi:ATP-dependent DNA ligase
MKVTVWEAKKATFPAFVQPKHNGIRFIDDGVDVVTREGNSHAPHIQRMVREAFGPLPGGWKRDGEACFPIEDRISIQRTNGAVKKEKPLSAGLIFPVFDGLHLNSSLVFTERYEIIKGDCLTRQVTCIEEVDEYYEQWLAQGYEGLIFRTNSPYRFGSALDRVMKRKPIKHAEFKIAAVWEGSGKAAGTPVYRLWRPGHDVGEEINNKTTFGASPDGPYVERYEMWAERDEVIGEQLTIRCWDFYDSGVPQFPIAETVRDYE